MSFPRRPALAVLPFCVSACWAQSQAQQPAEPPASQLEPVVVIGRKDPDRSTLTQPDLPTARKRLAQTPGGAGVVDASRYSEGRVSTLSDALGAATGVYVQPRFGAEEARISIRGSGLQRTFHGRGLKLMQDGVPLNLADGSFDFQAVEALSARYVEVWRGANALQYGASNLGGAINFVSPNGYNSDRFRVRAEAGSFDYRRLHVSTGDVHERFDYYLAASGFAQDGFRDHARQDSQRLFANLGYQLSEQLETRFYIGHVKSDSELPGSITKAQLEDDPRQANASSVSGNNRRDIRWTRLSNKTVYREGDHQLEAFAYLSDKQLHHPIFQVLNQDSRDYGAELRYTYSGDLAGRRNRFTFGISPSLGTTDEDRFQNIGGAEGARTNQSRQTARNLEVYVENQHAVLPQWSVITGLQFAQAKRRLEDRYVAGTAGDPVAEDFDMGYHGTSPKLGVLWDLAPQMQFFANVSRMFEPPTFSELAGGLRPNLNQAQRGTSFELGGRGQSGTTEWDVVLYEARLKNELLQIATDTANANITVNAPRTLHRGIEAGIRGRAFASAQGRVEWQLNGLLNDFRFRNDPTYGNRRLPGVPRYVARAQLGYRLAGGALLAVNAEGASGHAVDFADTLRADRYGIWGAKATGHITSSLSWFAEGRNLADRKYAATTGVIRDARGADSPQFLPGDGRSFYAGLDWKFN